MAAGDTAHPADLAALGSRCDFERASASELTESRFVADYLLPGKPVIVEGLTERWPAGAAWRAPRLLERHGDHPVLHEQPLWVSQYGAASGVPVDQLPAHTHSTLAHWVDKLWLGGGGRDDARLVFDRTSTSLARALLDVGDFAPPALLGAAAAT